MAQGPASVYLKNARFLLTMDPQRRLLENVSVAVAGDSIAAIGADSELADEWVGQDTRVIDAAQMFVTPGLVNSHIHLESCYDKGLLDDLPVVPWCERYFSYTYGTLTDESYYYAAMMSLLVYAGSAQLAALPLKEPLSFAKRILPTDLGEWIKANSDKPMWQAGIADGRLRTFNQPADSASLDPLSQRVKQQLDPFNLFRGHDHEHAA